MKDQAEEVGSQLAEKGKAFFVSHKNPLNYLSLIADYLKHTLYFKTSKTLWEKKIKFQKKGYILPTSNGLKLFYPYNKLI